MFAVQKVTKKCVQVSYVRRVHASVPLDLSQIEGNGMDSWILIPRFRIINNISCGTTLHATREQCVERDQHAVYTHLGAVNTHLGAVNTHLGAVNTHLGAVNTHLGAVNTHLDAVNARRPDCTLRAYSLSIRCPPFSSS